MKKRFSEEQIVKILQEHKEGKTISEVCRNYGIAENTFYIWQRKYGNMQLDDENRKLKRLVAELSLENMVQKDVIKNFSSPEL